MWQAAAPFRPVRGPGWRGRGRGTRTCRRCAARGRRASSRAPSRASARAARRWSSPAARTQRLRVPERLESGNGIVTSMTRETTSSSPVSVNSVRSARRPDNGVPGTGAMSTPTPRSARRRAARRAVGPEVPDVGGDERAGPRDAAHFGHRFFLIGNEVERQRRDDDVETARIERQRLGIGHAEVGERPPVFRAHGRPAPAPDRPRRRAAARSVDDQCGERARAAADVEPACAARRVQPVEELLAHGTAPARHGALVRGGVVEVVGRADMMARHSGRPQRPPRIGTANENGARRRRSQ